MPIINEQEYECPYVLNWMCSMEEPCKGCGNWEIALEEGKIKTSIAEDSDANNKRYNN